ncbi:MAG: DUF1343 domain-containing protein, partial [Paludibacter sp.]|nr:DUF1343 domain-containing protein [Paludibacter sp.]
MKNTLILLGLWVSLSFSIQAEEATVIVGAARTDAYLTLLKGKKVALFSNHTGIVNGKHTLDILLENQVNVTAVFSPEHGFRGDAGAGDHVASTV